MLIPKKLAVAIIATVGIVIVACSSSDDESQAISDESGAVPNGAVAVSAPTPVPTPEPIGTPTPTLAEKLSVDPSIPELVEPTPAPGPSPQPLANDEVSAYLSFGWNTDFSKHSVPYSEIRSAVPRDGIPPIDSPTFEEVSGNPGSLRDHEPVISLEINGEAKAYPLAILMWHEIVNDELGGVPVTVTYCPLCNTAIVFDRRVNGQILDFGTSGKLRNSDLIMWDRQTESWWQQITGEAIVGAMTGTKLTFIPAPLVSWSDFRDSFADGEVLSRNTGFTRDYNLPMYIGYDEADNSPFRFRGQIDSRLAAMERVIGVTVGDVVVAYPFTLFESVPVVNDTIGGQDIAIFYAGNTLSAFIEYESRDHRQVGSTGVFDPNLDAQKLTFRVEADRVVDDQTGSTWNLLGQAVEGPLQGSKLEQVVHANHFWFAWQAFNPETEIRSEETFTAR